MNLFIVKHLTKDGTSFQDKWICEIALFSTILKYLEIEKQGILWRVVEGVGFDQEERV